MRSIITYDPNEFLRAVTPIYAADDSRHGLMLGLAWRMAEHPRDYPGAVQVLVWDRRDVLAATGLMTPGADLLVQSDPLNKEALEALADRLWFEGVKVTGVNGVDATSDYFAQMWAEKFGLEAYRIKELNVLALSKVIPPAECFGEIKQAGFEDTSASLEMIRAMQKETGIPKESWWVLEDMQRAIANEWVFTWEVEGKPVAMAMFNRPTAKAISISGVYTKPEHRGKGYASCVVAAISQFALDRGNLRVNLFTDQANPTSNALYKRIGFKEVCQYHQYRMDQPLH